MKRIFAGLVGLLLGTAPALADLEADYVTLRTILRVDANCDALKYMEVQVVRELAGRILVRIAQEDGDKSGEVSAADYDAWLKQTEQRAEAEATRVACGPEAGNLIAIGRSVAAEDIYKGVLLAFHFASLPEEAFGHRPLAADRKDAAQRYDGMLAQLYGADYQGFVEQMKQLAAAELPALSSSADEEDALFVDPNHMRRLTDAQVAASVALDRVHFEVAAEMAGFRLRPADIGGGWVIPALVTENATAHMVEGPLTLFLPNQPWITIGVTLSADRLLRLVSWGENAAAVLAAPTVRLFVGKAPVSTDPWSSLDAPDWRDNAIAFDATAASEGCFGAPCFVFAPEATDAMLALGEGQYVELVVDAAAAVPPGAPRSPGNVQRLGTTRLVRVLALR